MPRIVKKRRTILIEPDEEFNFTPPPVVYPLSKDDLIDMYYDQRLSLSEIAKKTGRGETTIRRWMDMYKLPRRNYSEATILYHMKLKGEDSEEEED